MSNCGCKRDIDPAGIWDYKNLIGAKVRVKSMPMSNFHKGVFGDCTIEDIYFRISIDGKVITVIRLKEYPDLFFTWKDLEVLSVKDYPESICGSFKAGTALAGNNSEEEQNG